MNGLASSDPVSTAHSSDGGRNCFPVLCTDPGAGCFSSLSFSWGTDLLFKLGLTDMSLKVAHEEGGGSQHAVSGLVPCLSLCWILQACLMLPHHPSKEGRGRLSEGHFNFL